MRSGEISAEVAEAILTTSRIVADDARLRTVRHLMPNKSGMLWVLNVGVNWWSSEPGAWPWEHDSPATGYTELAEIETWHPVHVVPGVPGHTVAEVLAQLPDHLRNQTIGVEFLDLIKTGLNPSQPTPENENLSGWAMYRTLLYRHSTPLTWRVERRFALPNSAFGERSCARLIIDGRCDSARWTVTVRTGSSTGALIGSIAIAGYPSDRGDVIEEARQWIAAVRPADTRVVHFRCLNRQVPAVERGHIARAELTLFRQ
jgi:hypothetical protein